LIIKTIPIADIQPAKYNPRKDLKPGDPEYLKLAKSMKEFDLVEPLVWNKRSGNLVGGHQRLKILKDIGQTEVEVSVVDLSDAKEKALNLALNKISGEWDLPLLKDLLQEIDTGDFDIEVTGFDSKEIEDLVNQLHQPEEVLTDDDAIPENVETVCKKGDLWKLGNHRLLCGDATVITDVERLMDGQKADITFTSPPYNVGKNSTLSPHQKSGSKYRNGGDNKSDSEYLQLLVDTINNSLINSEYCFLNVQSLAGNKIVLIDLLHEMKPVYADSIVWDKQNAQPAMDNNVLNSQFEFVHIFSNKANRAIGTKDFRGTLSNVVSIPKKASETPEHNATFSVEFVSYFIGNFSSNSVLDLFGGSGSTLIACEKLNRKCRMLEIDEHYCDVIVKRWEDFTGKKAELINGES
jgi:DNA modification methylase